MPSPRWRFHALLDRGLPRSARQASGARHADALISYQRHGKRSYYLASTLSAGNDREAVFRRLSDQFELCAVGLSRVRREWEKIA